MDFFSPLTVSLFVLWSIGAFFDYCYFTYYLQLKEYRFDRFFDFLKTRLGRSYFCTYSVFWRGILAIPLYVVFYPTFSVYYVALLLLVIDLFYLTYKFLFKGDIRFPKITPKSASVVLISLLVEAVIIIFARSYRFLLLLLVFRFVIITILVSLLWLPNGIQRKIYILFAKKKIQKFPNLLVIGITGSYAKSTVKNFLSQILAKKFSVITTPGNINTEIGVAKFILEANFTKANIFIVEMGAYRRGEIKLISDMVKPKIGILTAINEQHLALFGSIRNTQAAKYELLRSLPDDGLAVVNSDNAYAREFLSELKAKVETYGVDEEQNPTCLIQDIQSTKKGIECTGRFKGQSGKIILPIFGSHNAANVAACSIVAFHLGMSGEEVREQLENLQPAEKGIHIFTYGKATIIDDSYNSNPDGFRAALEVLSGFSSQLKRIVVTRGMLELGDKSDEIHEKIGEEIAFVADELVIITPDSFDALSRGVGQKYQTEIKKIFSADELFVYIQSHRDVQSVILLENRVFSNVQTEIKKEGKAL